MHGRLTVVTAPPGLPLTTAEAKRQLHIDHSDDDLTLLPLLIGAVAAHIDGPQGLLGRAIVEQSWDLSIDRFPYCGETIELPLPPLISVDSISYVAADGTTQTLSASVYQVFGAGGLGKAQIAEAYGKSWPSTRNVREAVTIRFTCGYAPSNASPPDYGANVPKPIKQAIAMMVADLYEHRESAQVGSVASSVPISVPVAALLSPFKMSHF